MMYQQGEETLSFRVTQQSIVYCNESLQLENDFSKDSVIELVILDNRWILLVNQRPCLFRSFKANLLSDRKQSLTFELKHASADLEAQFGIVGFYEIVGLEQAVYSNLCNVFNNHFELLINRDNYGALLEFLKGTISIESEVGIGTSVTIQLLILD